MAQKKVVIIGGGVAGMSAAHELVKRKFDVEVYELKAIPGGKARSTEIEDSATEGRHKLPGEHGFRFFPRFYKHVTTTMKEIPFGDKTVYDNLVETTEIRVARFDKSSFYLPSKFPTSIDEIKKYIALDEGVDLGLSDAEKQYFAERVWQLMTSSYERRKQEYERLPWWEFLDANHFSENYKTFLARGLTRTLVAAKAEKVSTKTGGDILLQLMFDIMMPGMSSDRILNGPTNDVWMEPWLDFLRKQGVRYHLNAKAKQIKCKGEAVESVVFEVDGEEKTVVADYFISAVPVEVLASLLNEDMLYIDPTLANIKQLSNHVAWMNGLQLYLSEDVKINHGHTIYINTPWALTSISQAQFWSDFDWAKHGDGKVKGILSIDISDWDTPGLLFGKPASACTTTEIAQECWHQLKISLNVEDQTVLKDEYLHFWNLDDSIVPGVPCINKEPLLVNDAGTWVLRPYPYCDIENFFMASDFVKTNTDLATMEGANEAARRAVNAIIDKSGSWSSYCEVWNLHEPWWLVIFRYRDRGRYAKGLPWDGKLPFGMANIMKVARFFISLFK
jgi:15-cis-phytoene desaturase